MGNKKVAFKSENTKKEKKKEVFSSSLTAMLYQKIKVFPDYIAFISQVLASPL